MNTSTLYRLLGEAVKYSPDTPGSKVESLQTFAAVRNAGEWDTENLGKTPIDKAHPFFFSKKWAAMGYSPNNITFDYPALFAVEQFGSLAGVFTGNVKNGARIQLSAVYPNVQKLENATLKASCEFLPTLAIYPKMKALLFQALNYLGGSVYAVVDGNPAAWYNEGFLQAALAAGDITAYTIQEKETNAFRKQIQAANEAGEMGFIDDEGGHLLCGVSVSFAVTELYCETVNYSYDTANCCTPRN